jgi:SAM-dependent methyltransferase
MVDEIIELYRDGRHYDRLYIQGQDLPFWLEQARRYGGPILELGCGTGRVALTLAQAGFDVTGIDVAEGMLREARRKAVEAGLAVEWVHADMRALDLGRTFALILLPANALGHLLDLGDFEACMASVKRHLAPGGRFVIDFFVPKTSLLLDEPDKRFPFAESDDPEGQRIAITHSYVYEPDTQIKRVTTYHTLPGEPDEIEGQLVIRMYFPQELDALCKYNGLEIEAKYGAYDGRPFDATSEKQLIVCRAMVRPG